MKKIFTLLGLLLLGIVVKAQTPVDFETSTLTWGAAASDVNASFANPSKTGINISNTVLQIATQADGPNYGLAYTNNYTPFLVTTANCVVKMMVYKPVTSNVTFSFKPNDMSSSLELSVPNTTINQWEELTFDFTPFIGKTVIELAVFVDNRDHRPTAVTGYFDNISFNDQSTLPLKLTSFTGSFNGLQNTLNWKTASELNINHFEVEKSIDGKLFSKIGELKGGKSEYSFVDKNISFIGALYYRLKMIDNDGTFTYSNIVAINNKSKNETSFSFYPNPAIDYLNVNLISKEASTATLSVYDLSGKLIRESIHSFNIGNNTVRVNTSDLQSGSYLLRITDNKSKLIQTRKFLVSR
ncbi:T9SS type A sorting domain-containing protein [Pedobacter sp. SD-b]|uniref:T9SS type A sorting domain-containing protein n=1 Tax=Pedobacter segetis TaxID=2793069 RepID=A0ABS1BHB7_9SPHI|nr:T9SS type A sorting domain-containing protein [Pedobacter segetis]MBK0382263.1 T9SS type A sorting domain-containing protein [Pedobacter segetis]